MRTIKQIHPSSREEKRIRIQRETVISPVMVEKYKREGESEWLKI